MSKLRDRFNDVMPKEPTPDQPSMTSEELARLICEAFPKDEIPAPYYDGVRTLFGDVSKIPTCKSEEKSGFTPIYTQASGCEILALAEKMPFLLKWRKKVPIAGCQRYLTVKLQLGHLMALQSISIENSEGALLLDNRKLECMVLISPLEILCQILQLYRFTVTPVDADVCKEKEEIEFSLLAENGKKIGSISMETGGIFDTVLDKISEANSDYQPATWLGKIFFKQDEPKRIAYFPLPLSELFKYMLNSDNDNFEIRLF